MNVLLLLQERTSIQQALLHSPPGHLVYHKGRYGAQQYTRPSDHKRVQKYIRMKDLPQLEARYREKATLEARLQEIEKLLRADPKEVKRVKAQLQREERNLLETLRKPHSAQYRHLTLRGEYVASKSEALLADYLYFHHIPYEYEQPLFVRGVCYHPDFTLSIHGVTVYVEHLGLLDQPQYAEEWKKKYQQYQSIGIHEGFNLICTREHEGAINMQEIDHQFRDMGVIGKNWDKIAVRDQERIRRRREKKK